MKYYFFAVKDANELYCLNLRHNIATFIPGKKYCIETFAVCFFNTFDFKLLFYKLNDNTGEVLGCWSSLPCTELSDLGVAVIVDSDQFLRRRHPG